MLITDVLAATSSSDDTSFSIPILVGAAALGVGWVLLLVAVAAWRRPHGIRSGAATQDLPPAPPAVAGLLCNDFELPAELPPATLLDLAARHVVRLEEVEPGKTICRLRGTAENEPLTRYEQRVVDEVRRKAVDGVVPTDALTTGAEDASSAWHRAYSKEVIGDARGRGLTRDRWPDWLVSLLGVGPFAIGGLLYLAGVVGGEGNDHPVAAGIAGGVALLGIVLLGIAAGRLTRSLAQLPTEAGKEMTVSRPPRPPARERATRRSPAGSCADVGPALRVRGRDVASLPPRSRSCRSAPRTTTARGAASAGGAAACASGTRMAGRRGGANTPRSPRSSRCSGARLRSPRSMASGASRSRPPTRSPRPIRCSTATSSTGSVAVRSC